MCKGDLVSAASESCSKESVKVDVIRGRRTWRGALVALRPERRRF